MTIVIVGDGKVGLALTQMLSAEDHDVTVVDQNPRVLARTLEEFDALSVVGHGASRAVLLEAGVDKADLLIAATSSDEINLLSCLVARRLGCGHTIARVRSYEYADDIKYLQDDLGLSFVINPEEACALEILHLLQIPSFLQREQFAQGRVEIVKIKVSASSPLRDVQLTDLYTTAHVRVLVCAVDRGGDAIIPGGSFVIREGDDLFITAASENLRFLIDTLCLDTHKVTHVTIVGGSRLGFYLSQRLLHSGVGVRIIEKDHNRCEILADHLPDADIVEADGTEREVLLSEGVERSDALVALTGIDEENIVLSLYAKELGVPKTITKCNRTQYAEMFRKLNLGTVVSPKDTIAEDIVRYVRAMENSSDGKMVTMHQIASGKAEALEFPADGDCKVLGIPLVDLPVRQGILIACIVRGVKTIIPTGQTEIIEGDSVVVVVRTGCRILDLDDILE